MTTVRERLAALLVFFGVSVLLAPLTHAAGHGTMKSYQKRGITEGNLMAPLWYDEYSDTVSIETESSNENRQFLTDDQPPDPPSLISPSDHLKTNDVTPVFTWSEPADPGGSGIKNYRIYIDDDSTFTAPRVKEYTTSNTYYAPTLYEGYFYWRVYAKDNGGNQSEWSEVWELEIDTTPPTSGCSSPDYDNDGTIDLTWTADDSVGSGVFCTKLYFKYDIDGMWIYSTGDSAVGTTGSFIFTPPSGDGPYYFQTVATDSANNTEPITPDAGDDSTMYDTTAPETPSLISPVDGAHMNDMNVTLTWSTSSEPEPGSGIKNYRILMDDEPDFSTPYVKSAYTSSTSYTPTLGEGHYYWKALARDNATNNSDWSSVWEFIIDTTPPAITCPIDTTIECGDSIHPTCTGSASATDNYDENPTITYSDENSTVAVSRTWTATDAGGNSTQCQQTITIEDTTPPNVTPPAAVTVNTDQGACTASAVDLGIPAVSDRCDTNLTVTNDAPALFALGKTTVTWTVTDPPGNGVTCTQDVTVDDDEVPTFQIDGPEHLCWNGPPHIPYLGFHDNCGLDEGWYALDSGLWTSLFSNRSGASWEQKSWSLAESLFLSLSDGSHSLHFKAEDDCGNVAGGSGNWILQFYKDTVPPGAPKYLAGVSHTPGVWSDENEVCITWVDASDGPDACGLLGYSILWDTDSTSIPEPDTTADFVPAGIEYTCHTLNEGCHFFHIRSVDIVGNWQTEPEVVHFGPFCIDVTKPTCAIADYTEDPIEVCGNIRICFTGQDTYTPDDSLRFSCMLVGVDQKPSECLPTQCVSYNKLPEGIRTFWVWACDLAGNRSPSAECAFEVSSDYCVKGDVIADCDINVQDAIRCIQIILDQFPEPTAGEQCRADYNGDGSVSIPDALSIVNVILGINPQYPLKGCPSIVSPAVLSYCNSLESLLSTEEYTHFMALVRRAHTPSEYSLSQNYPTPFNSCTDIRYQIPDSRSPIHTTLKIYNIIGQEVLTLVDEEKEPGFFTATWDGRNVKGNEVPGGVYFYQMKAGNFSATKRMVMIK
ncbi:MAG: HYR domain-containing protein [Gemmatimonadota bacterium]|nr:MAG: HYR domain-containing protein [Gemmatimonadota bacterium]